MDERMEERRKEGMIDGRVEREGDDCKGEGGREAIFLKP